MSSTVESEQTSSKVIHYFDTQLCADSVEWCPLAPFHQVFALGTYEVVKSDESDQSSEAVSPSTKRHGRLYLFRVPSMDNLDQLQVIDLPAILDMKWCHDRIKGNILLAVATAVGQLLIYQLQENLQLLQISKTILTGKSDKELLALSIDWSTGLLKENVEEVHLAVSDSHGKIHLFLLNDFNLDLVRHLDAHGYEAWITAFDYWNPCIIYSGGDDCNMCVWDTRIESSTPQKKISSFDAGVTSLHSNAKHENILACGSYDETLRIWDTRKMKQPLNSKNLSGGIWRVKWDPHEYQYIIAACMYNGVHLLDCTETLLAQGEISGVYHSSEHKSIAYGADWCYSSGTEITSMFHCPSHWEDSSKTALVATCSFYDKQLHISLSHKIKY